MPAHGRIEIDSNTVERSIRPITLNRKSALFACEPDQFCRLDDARSLCQLFACPIELIGLGSWPAQSYPHVAGLAHKFAVALDLGFDDAQAVPDALADHRAFELGGGVFVWASTGKLRPGRGSGLWALSHTGAVEANAYTHGR